VHLKQCAHTGLPANSADIQVFAQAERALLYVLGFRFQVDPPAAKLLEISARFKLDSFYKSTASPALSQVAVW